MRKNENGEGSKPTTEPNPPSFLENYQRKWEGKFSKSKRACPASVTDLLRANRHC